MVKGNRLIIHSKIDKDLRRSIRGKWDQIEYNDILINNLRIEYQSHMVFKPGIVKNLSIRPVDSKTGSVVQLTGEIKDFTNEETYFKKTLPLVFNKVMDKKIKKLFVFIKRQGSFLYIFDKREKEEMITILKEIGIEISFIEEDLKKIFKKPTFEDLSEISLIPDKNLNKSDMINIGKEIFKNIDRDFEDCFEHGSDICYSKMEGSNNRINVPIFCSRGRGPNRMLAGLIVTDFRKKIKLSESLLEKNEVITRLIDCCEFPFEIGNKTISFNRFVKMKFIYDNLCNQLFNGTCQFEVSLASIGNSKAHRGLDNQIFEKLSGKRFFWSFDEKSFKIEDPYEGESIKPISITNQVLMNILPDGMKSLTNFLKKSGDIKTVSIIKDGFRWLYNQILMSESIEISRLKSNFTLERLQEFSDSIPKYLKNQFLELSDLENNISKEKDIFRKRELKYEHYSRELQLLGLSSKKLMSYLINNEAKKLINREKEMEAPIMIDSESDLFLILVNNLNGDPWMIDNDRFKSKLKLEMNTNFNLSAMINTWRVEDTIEKGKKLLSQKNEIENFSTDWTVEKPDPFIETDENEFDDNFETNLEETKSSKTFIDCSFKSGVMQMNELKRIFEQTDLDLNHSYNLKTDLEYLKNLSSFDAGDQEAYNELLRIEGGGVGKGWFERFIVVLKKSSDFRSLRKKFNLDFLTSENKFNYLEENKIQMMNTLGEFFSTGFRSSDVKTGFLVKKMAEFQINSADSVSRKNLKDLSNTIMDVNEEDFNDLEEESQEYIYQLKNSISKIVSIIGIDLTRENKLKFSHKRINTSLKNLKMKRI